VVYFLCDKPANLLTETTGASAGTARLHGGRRRAFPLDCLGRRQAAGSALEDEGPFARYRVEHGCQPHWPVAYGAKAIAVAQVHHLSIEKRARTHGDLSHKRRVETGGLWLS
jgi:hypothetical protein